MLLLSAADFLVIISEKFKFPFTQQNFTEGVRSA